MRLKSRLLKQRWNDFQNYCKYLSDKTSVTPNYRHSLKPRWTMITAFLNALPLFFFFFFLSSTKSPWKFHVKSTLTQYLIYFFLLSANQLHKTHRENVGSVGSMTTTKRMELDRCIEFGGKGKNK